MNGPDAVLLCRMAKGACPQQHFDEYTPDMWLRILGDLRFADCEAAVATVTSRQPFVSPSEIRDEVKRLRARRMDGHPPLVPPAELNDLEQMTWLREARAAIADGETIDQPALPSREMPNLDIFQRVPKAGYDTPAAKAAREASRKAIAAARRPVGEEPETGETA